MKSLIIIATTLVMNLALACPGGNLKILTVKGQAVGQVNITENTVSLNSGLNLVNVNFQWDNSNKSSAFAHAREELPRLLKRVGDQTVFDVRNLKDLDLTQSPSGSLIVIASPQPGSMATYYWVVKNFQISRGIECAQEVEAGAAY